MAKTAAHNKLHELYLAVKEACKRDYASKEASDAILILADLSLQFLEKQTELVALVSRVPGKEYVSYRLKKVVARPANKALWLRDGRDIQRVWKEWQTGNTMGSDLARVTYTMALAPCLAMELFDRQNKKVPATYF